MHLKINICSKCSYPKPEAYDEIKANEEDRIKKLEEKYHKDMESMKEDIENKLSTIIEMIQQNPKLAYMKSDVLTDR